MRVIELAIGRCEHDWGTELTGFGRPFGLGFDAARRLHVTDMDRHLLYRFDARLDRVEWHDGGSSGWNGPLSVSPNRTSAAAPAAAAGWNGPHAVDFGADGSLYVTCYYGAAIHVLAADGSPVARLGHDILHGPASAFLNGAGLLMVAEYADSAVLLLDTAGHRAGRLRGAFDRPHMARALPNGTIAVADTWNNRVQRFTSDGDLLDADWISPVACPVAVDPADDGRMLVTVWGENIVIAFDPSGQNPGRLTSPPLDHPYDARWMGRDVVVADSHNARVLILRAPDFRG